MASENLKSVDLKEGLLRGGLIREDVMNKIWDISKIPLPFSDLVGSETHKNSYKEWTTDELAAPDVSNAVIDGDDALGNNTKTGKRVGNQGQISDKVVKVSYRADASDTIGRAKELSYQLSRRQQELRRDVEAIALENQASVADNGTDTAGLAGGLPTWLETTVTNGTAGGFNTGTGLTGAWTTSGGPVGLTEAQIRDTVESIYNEGGDPTVLMSVPKVIRLISEYLFTSSARVATLYADQGKASEKATALGSINVFVTDFGTLEMVPNRLQQKQQALAADDSAFLFVLDPGYAALSYQGGYRTDMLAKTGLAENRQMSVDWTLCVHNEKAHGMIGDVSLTTAMAAS